MNVPSLQEEVSVTLPICQNCKSWTRPDRPGLGGVCRYFKDIKLIDLEPGEPQVRLAWHPHFYCYLFERRKAPP
jgi:hypothetical protein